MRSQRMDAPLVRVFNVFTTCVHSFSVLVRAVFTYVFVVHQFHELELAVRPFRVRDILEGPTELLYGHVLIGYRVQSGTGKCDK